MKTKSWIIALAALGIVGIACEGVAFSITNLTATPVPPSIEGAAPTPTVSPPVITAVARNQAASISGASAPAATVSAEIAGTSGVGPTATPRSVSVVGASTATPAAEPTPMPTATPRPTAIPQPTPTPSPTPVSVPAISTAPVASFTVDVSRGQAPLLVTFDNKSTGKITSYEWNFGGDVTTDAISPSRPFTRAGSHTISLTAIGPGGRETFVLVDAFIVEAGPVASIEISENASAVPAGKTVQLSAAIADEFGNDIDVAGSWTVDETAGIITDDGVFTATTVAGRYSLAVSVAVAGVTGVARSTTNIVVVPGLLSEIALIPDALEVPLSSFRRFEIAARDEFGNEVSDFTVTWWVDLNAGTIDDEGGYVTGTVAGTFPGGIRVDAVQGAARATASADIIIE